MATQGATLTRDELAALPDSYFRAVDAMDLDGIMAHWADDATMTIQTAHTTFNGADEIRRMFTDFIASSVFIRHDIRNIVVEPGTMKVATEQGYQGELKDGTKNDMHNCNFFDVGPDGRFTRVIIFMSGSSPLV
jgi:ketosteroid isomerase-like protein